MKRFLVKFISGRVSVVFVEKIETFSFFFFIKEQLLFEIKIETLHVHA